jgi:two-component system NtrC family sensor kinase
MKKIPLVFVLVFSFSSLNAQKINVDSLVRVVISRSSGNDGSSATILPNRDSLLNLLPSTKSPAARIKLIYDIILNNGELDPTRAFYYHRKILDLTRKNNDAIGESVIMGELGYTICQNGDIAEGLKMLYKALQLAEKTGNKQAIGTVYDNLGVCYPGNLNLQKSYFSKALKYSLAGGDIFFACFELSNLSNIYAGLKKPDSAKYFRLKSFELAVRNNIDAPIVRDLDDLGNIQTDPRLKLKYWEAALKMPFAKKDASTRTYILEDFALYYYTQHRIDSALFYAKRAYREAVNSSLMIRGRTVGLLSLIYKKHNADSALKYTETAYMMRDSMFNINKLERAQSMAFAEQQRQQDMEAQKAALQNNLRLTVLIVIIVFLLLLAFVFWRNNKQNKLAKAQIQHTLDELKLTQTQLIQSEKMASLGELTAGIAHEIQNPLNFVNNFSEVNTELIDEMQVEIEKGNLSEVKAIAVDLKGNEQKINMHGKRADSIVKSMLEHSRINSGQKELTDLNALAAEYMRLSYHGLRAKDKSFNSALETHLDGGLPKVNVIPQDIGRVLLNLFNNAFYAVHQKKKQNPEGYSPEVVLTTSSKDRFIEISVKDNGNGIPDNIKEKIMQPFFTTKPTGEGTGLGLSLSYDIVVKGHSGSISIGGTEGQGSEFIIKLPSE